MRLAIDFKRDFPLNDKADEFNVWFSPRDSDADKLIEFADAYKDKYVNVSFRGDADTGAIAYVSKRCGHDNVRFVLSEHDIPLIDDLKACGAQYYFRPSCACKNFLDLHSFIDELGVCAVYVIDDLCYDMEDVRRICDKGDVDIRVVLNQCPVTVLTDSPTTMFYRPQDMDVLDRYFDVAEFDVGVDKAYDFGACKALYRVFFEKRDWYGDLRDINRSLKFSVYNRSLPKFFSSKRFNCGMRCLVSGAPCNSCGDLVEISNLLAKRDIQLASAKPEREHATQDEVETMREDMRNMFSLGGAYE